MTTMRPQKPNGKHLHDRHAAGNVAPLTQVVPMVWEKCQSPTPDGLQTPKKLTSAAAAAQSIQINQMPPPEKPGPRPPNPHSSGAHRRTA